MRRRIRRSASSSSSSPSDSPAPELDLTGEGPPQAPPDQPTLDLASDEPPPPNRLASVRTEPYDPAPLREETRSWLAQGLLILFGVVALALVGLLAADRLTDAEAKDLATGVLSPIVAVTGTALGFYFGGQKNGK